ncbi:MAG: hypothetical protein R2874_11290 [Desulfobacterales bacterium]
MTADGAIVRQAIKKSACATVLILSLRLSIVPAIVSLVFCAEGIRSCQFMPSFFMPLDTKKKILPVYSKFQFIGKIDQTNDNKLYFMDMNI